MEKTNFAEICKLMESKHSEILECIGEIFNVALLFLPSLVCRDVAFIANIANGVDLLDAKNTLAASLRNVKNVITKQKYNDFTTKYECAQTAQVLIVFSAYFDSIQMYLPDEEGRIEIPSGNKIALTKESIEKYAALLKRKARAEAGKSAKEIFEKDLTMPDPIESFDDYLNRLRTFYVHLNNEFVDFYDLMFFGDQIPEHKRDKFRAVIQKLPDIAVENYEKQYYTLAAQYNDFFVWTSLQEHKTIEQKIDVGFSELDKNMKRYFEENHDRKAVRTLEKFQKTYEEHIHRKIIDTSDTDYSFADGIAFPEKEEIFIPQSFKTLHYKQGMSLENPDSWDSCRPREDIGKFIGDTLRHSHIGNMPLLILGNPGAGKSTLCHMLAAKILSHEYHVIIINLRDTVAEDPIHRQINHQIEQTFSNNCTWDDIMESGLKKPVLLIFDGYDELLQASGKTYADYLKKITEFQKEQKTLYNTLVKCIVTSRRILIDKASIVTDTPVIDLCDFDDKRIKAWSEIWNKKNVKYFEANGLEKFDAKNAGKGYELAKQPLLLTMLAIFDSNNNALKQHRDLNSTQLYDSLIHDFILREKNKNAEFRNKQPNEQKKEIDEEIYRISLAALGMYNRKELYIRSADLQLDLKYAAADRNAFDAPGLSESDKLLGSFLFIHKSEAVYEAAEKRVRASAYMFLHNTFGEFLTADLIVRETYKILKNISDSPQYQWRLAENKQWCVCLSYAPLFLRPVVIQMICEWSHTYFTNHNFGHDDADKNMTRFVDGEIEKIISGENIFDMNEIISEEDNPFKRDEVIKHLAIYSINLIILRTVTCADKYQFKYTDDMWNKLICLWKYAFSREDLLSFSKLFKAAKEKDYCMMEYMPNKGPQKAIHTQISQILAISSSLGDSLSYSLAAAVKGGNDESAAIKSIEDNKLYIGARFMWNHLLNKMFEYGYTGLSDLIDCFRRFLQLCIDERDLQYMLVFYLGFDYALKESIIRIDKYDNDNFANLIIQSLTTIEHMVLTTYERDIVESINKIVFGLLEYINLDKAQFESLLNYYEIFSTAESLIDYQSRMANNILYMPKYYNRILRKILSAKESNPNSMWVAGYEYMLRRVPKILERLESGVKYISYILYDVLELSYNLSLLKDYKNSTRIFERCASLVLRENFHLETPHIAVLIKYLYTLKINNYSHTEHVERLIIDFIDYTEIRTLLEVCPDAMSGLCYLLRKNIININSRTIDNLIIDNLIQIIKLQGSSISADFYIQASKLAEEKNYTELKKLLDELLQD